MTRLRSLVLLPLAVVVAASVNACGDDTAATGGNPSGVTGGGAAGAASGGASGKASGGASAGGGAAGNAAAGTNAGGTSAGGTSAGGTSAGGTSAGGTNAGGTSAGGCTKDEECAGSLVPTKPEGCAEAYCNAGKCGLRAKDADADGFRTNKCQAVTDKPVEVELGKDCDDTKKDVNPAAWDGPAGEGHPNACADGVDQNCSGADGDDLLANGASCACTPGDTSACSETAAGVPIVFPGGQPAPGSVCARGSKTCEVDPVTGGKWGPCINARGPQPEVCNASDDDCDGEVDEADATGKSDWLYDGDGDGQAALIPGVTPPTPFASVQSCSTKPPSEYPVECTDAYCGSIPKDQCCPKNGWRLNLPKLDCDDRHATALVGGVEMCGNDIDEDCDGQKDDDGAVGEKDWVYDGDGDGFGSLAIGIQRSCAAPACDAVTGPNCAGKWKVGLPLTDCDDTKSAVRPGVVEDCGTTYDDNCNGSTGDGCACAPGDPPLDCGAPGDCAFVAKGSTCSGGKYTACPTPITKVEYCPDVDGDGYCATSEGNCALYCPSGDPAQLPPTKFIQRANCTNASGVTDCKDDDVTVNPVAQELCGDGKDSNCKTLAKDSDSDGYALGDICSVVAVKGSAGVCLNGGKKVCASVGATTTSCKANEGSTGSSTPQASAGANGSWDWDCDGKTSITRRECRRNPLKMTCECGNYTFDNDQSVTELSQWTSSNLLKVQTAPTCASFVGQTSCEKRGPLHFYALCGANGCGPDPDCGSTIGAITCVWSAATTTCLNSKNIACAPGGQEKPSGNTCN